jgi:hypothetical protein
VLRIPLQKNQLVTPAVVVAAALFAALTLLLGFGVPAAGLLEWLAPGWVAGAWLLMAYGFGTALRAWAFPGLQQPSDPRRVPLALAMGVAAALAIDNLLGTLGLLQPNGAWAIGTTALGGTLALHDAWRRRRPFLFLRVHASAAAWFAIPALAALAIAAMLPPGLGWSSEFGGYDALAYHLQLPKEWFELGAIRPLAHNAYSGFPSFVEGAYLHLMALHGGSQAPQATAVAAQALHAMLAVTAAGTAGAIAAATILEGPGDVQMPGAVRARALGTVFLLGMPWILVTGSLAYDEMAALLCLGGAMLAWTSQGRAPGFRLAGVLGLLLGAMVGCKLSMVPMGLLPFGAFALLWPAGSLLRKMIIGTCAVIVMALVLAPWLVRDATVAGAATFPFRMPGAGADAPVGWWDAARAERFAAAHAPDRSMGWMGTLGLASRTAFADGVVRGLDPDAAGSATPAWYAAWAPAMWAGLAALAVMLFRPASLSGVTYASQWFEDDEDELREERFRALAFAALLGLQLAAWVLLTHMKARFLLPCAVPIAALVALAGTAAWNRADGRRRRFPVRARAMLAAGAAVLLAWAAQPLAALWLDARIARNVEIWATTGDPGVIGRGNATLVEQARGLGDPLPLAWAANWLLPPDARLGCEGEADVFWITRTPDYGDVWDGGPLAAVLRAHGDDADAAVRALRARGLTHLAIGEAMLARWKASGWLDPALTPDRVRAVAARLQPVARLTSGGVLYALPVDGR